MSYAEAFVAYSNANIKRGNDEEIGAGDLVAWLSAIHVAQLAAGDEYDVDAWGFFAEWYAEVSE